MLCLAKHTTTHQEHESCLHDCNLALNTVVACAGNGPQGVQELLSPRNSIYLAKACDATEQTIERVIHDLPTLIDMIESNIASYTDAFLTDTITPNLDSAVDAQAALITQCELLKSIMITWKTTHDPFEPTFIHIRSQFASICKKSLEWTDSHQNDPDTLLATIQKRLNALQRHPTDLQRKRPDAIAVNWRQREILLLEFTRTYDANPDALTITDELKRNRYEPLRSTIAQALGPHWTVQTMPFTAGVRGSLHVPTWQANLARLGMSAHQTTRILKSVIDDTLDGLLLLMDARDAAITSGSKHHT